jgi:hypothetical protein
MAKTGRETRLIDYISLKDSEDLKKNWPQKPRKKIGLSGKILLYASAFSLVLIAFVVSLAKKETILLQIEKEASPIFTRKADGSITNSYNLIITNKTIKNLDGFCLQLEALEDLKIIRPDGKGLCQNLEAGTSFETKLIVTLPYEKALKMEEKTLQIKFLFGEASVKNLFHLG